MSKQEKKVNHLQSELSEQLILMFGFNHPQLFSMQLDRMFFAWNATEDANEAEVRESMQLTLQMMKEFFFIFAKEEPETVASLLKSNLSKSMSYEQVL